MKLLAAMVATLSLSLFSQGVLAQAGSSPVPLASDTESRQSPQTVRIMRTGAKPSAKVPAEHFTGIVHIDLLFSDSPPSHNSGGRVTFEPGSRTAWHRHTLGQTLVVTAGTGWVQQWGGQVEEIRAGDVTWIPPNVKHWHGATATASMTHIAIQESLDGKAVEWMEKVSDQQYRNSQSAPEGVTNVSKEPSAAQKLFGDFDPKLAELTDNVLFADVWERPGLSKRDRSLITVAALVALNRPEQLRAHLQRAKENGVTKDEVVEVITHLAFYAGWPNAVSAIPIARETFK